jgi:hypothetical protein
MARRGRLDFKLEAKAPAGERRSSDLTDDADAAARELERGNFATVIKSIMSTSRCSLPAGE